MMSYLQERSDSAVYLVLSILEGHGFGFLQSPVVIVAVTCGIHLESEVVPPSPDPVFHVDLVWETNKKSLRRFRASNTPIKLECFTVAANKKRDCIGSILLNIKTAQVLSNGSETKVNERWHKLIGVPPDAKALQPELLLSLKIQETIAMPFPPPSSVPSVEDSGKVLLVSPKNCPALATDTNLAISSSAPTHESPVPFYNAVDRYIQIGLENSSLHMFLLTLNIRDIVGLGMLMSGRESSSATDDSEGFQLAFTIVNHSFNSKVFTCSDWDEICNVNETIVVRLRATLSALYYQFHEHSSVPVHLLWNGGEVAAAELHLRSLVPTDNILSFSHEFLGESTCSQRCFLVSARSGSIPSQNDARPYVEIFSKLQLVNQAAFPSKVIPSSPQKNSSKSPSTPAVESVGDIVSSRSESRQSQDTFILSAQSGPKWVPVAPNPIQDQSSASQHMDTEGVRKINDISRENNVCTVCIRLNKLVLKDQPQSTRLRFMFECSKKPILTSDLSDIVIESSHSPIALSGICAKISLQSPVDQIEEKHIIEVILSEVCANPTVTQPFAFANININLINLLEKRECEISSPLKHSRNLRDVGVIHGLLTLEYPAPQSNCETGHSSLPEALDLRSKKIVKFSTTSDMSAHLESKAVFAANENITGLWHPQSNELQIMSAPLHVLPTNSPVVSPSSATVTHSSYPLAARTAPLDPVTAFRIVEELEDWKEKQQELFHAELKQKEVDHLSQMSEELMENRKELESELGCKITQCKALLLSLSNAREDLRDRLKHCQQREQELFKEKEELEHQYNMKFQELTFAAKRLDEGAKLKVSLAELKSSKLQDHIAKLESENENLREQLCQRKLSSVPCGDGHTCGMSHNQVTKLLSQVNQLEEKLQTSLQSKAYFKEQWGRAVREINQVRPKAAQNSGKHSMDFVLEKEEAELKHDKKALEELHKELASYSLGQNL